MPLFVIIGHDVANSSQQRATCRPKHIQRLNELKDQNRLIIAGPTPISHDANDMTGSIIIAQFDDLASCQAWVDDEPYLLQGVYSHVDIRPFIKALP